MKKIVLIFSVFGMLNTAYAQTKAPPVPSIASFGFNEAAIGGMRIKSKAFGEPALRFREIEATTLSKEWQDKYSKPYLGEGGRVIYHYGDAMHTVVCAPLNICDIELQTGEKIQAAQIGDKVRWHVQFMVSGSGSGTTSHIIIKPKRANLNTTLVVATDRRTYHLNLKSDQKKIMALVSFEYPEDMQADLLRYHAQIQQDKEAKTVDIEGIRIAADQLDFDYTIAGDTPIWTPIRVFNDSNKTYIQMPKALKQSNAPAFLALDEFGEEQIVNYRVRGDKYIIDRVIHEGLLIAGVGRKQTKVVITKGTRSSQYSTRDTQHYGEEEEDLWW